MVFTDISLMATGLSILSRIHSLFVCLQKHVYSDPLTTLYFGYLYSIFESMGSLYILSVKFLVN